MSSHRHASVYDHSKRKLTCHPKNVFQIRKWVWCKQERWHSTTWEGLIMKISLTFRKGSFVCLAPCSSQNEEWEHPDRSETISFKLLHIFSWSICCIEAWDFIQHFQGWYIKYTCIQRYAPSTLCIEKQPDNPEKFKMIKNISNQCIQNHPHHHSSSWLHFGFVRKSEWPR